MSSIFDRNGTLQSLSTVAGMNTHSHSNSFSRFGAIGSLVKSLFSMFM